MNDRARLEDLAFMAAHGETREGAAARLGITVTALEKWCDRHQHRDLWALLGGRL